MTKRTVVHVVPGKGEGWDVKKAGENAALAHFQTKEQAVQHGKGVAKESGLGQIKIHKQDGQIQTEYTYGKDPRRTRG